MTKKRIYKQSLLEKKANGIKHSVNQSNVNQLKKIAKVKITEELPQVPLIDLYMHVKGVWQHKGKTCGNCGLLINDPVVIDKHRYICKAINKSRGTTDAST